MIQLFKSLSYLICISILEKSINSILCSLFSRLLEFFFWWLGDCDGMLLIISAGFIEGCMGFLPSEKKLNVGYFGLKLLCGCWFDSVFVEFGLLILTSVIYYRLAEKATQNKPTCYQNSCSRKFTDIHIQFLFSLHTCL